MTHKPGWIAVDLDGTLAQYDGWVDVTNVGPPVKRMVLRVQAWIRAGRDVRIFTARISTSDLAEREKVVDVIEQWCVTHIGKKLPVTNVKDKNMEELWDDRAVRVIKNTGMSMEEYIKNRRR